MSGFDKEENTENADAIRWNWRCREMQLIGLEKKEKDSHQFDHEDECNDQING